jgi:hypothetical protein
MNFLCVSCTFTNTTHQIKEFIQTGIIFQKIYMYKKKSAASWKFNIFLISRNILASDFLCQQRIENVTFSFDFHNFIFYHAFTCRTLYHKIIFTLCIQEINKKQDKLEQLSTTLCMHTKTLVTLHQNKFAIFFFDFFFFATRLCFLFYNEKVSRWNVFLLTLSLPMSQISDI